MGNKIRYNIILDTNKMGNLKKLSTFAPKNQSHFHYQSTIKHE